MTCDTTIISAHLRCRLVARVVVIGAGVGGMAAAARLAVKGHDVTIVEQSARAGGKLAGYSRDGFVFDTGPSLLTLPAVYRDLFLKTGSALEENVDLQLLDIGFGYHFADGAAVTMPGVDSSRCADALGDQLGGHAATEWRELIARARRMWDVTRRPFLESPLEGTRTLAQMAWRLGDVRTVAPWKSLRGLGRDYLSDPRLVTLLDRYATYAGSDPRRAPAALATIPYVEQTFGTWHLGGGLFTLADALHHRCVERGVDVRLECDVTRVVADAGRVTGVELVDGDRLAADIVVSDSDASRLYGDLVSDPAARKARRALKRATPSLSGFVMLLAVRGRTPGIRHHNVWFPSDYDAEFDSIFGLTAGPVDDPTIYACVPDDPLMRPDSDHESWFILVNAPRHAASSTGASTGARGATGVVDWSAPGVGGAYGTHVLEVLARRGVDLRDRILWSEIRTPADLERETRSPGGAIYGTSSNGARAAFLRPANQSPIAGLYLVGGSAHPGGGLPLVGLSADIVATLIGRA